MRAPSSARRAEGSARPTGERSWRGSVALVASWFVRCVAVCFAICFGTGVLAVGVGCDEPESSAVAEAPEEVEERATGSDGSSSERSPPYRPHALAAFFRALEATEEEGESNRTHVLHVGDSHTASDTLTGRIRTLFQEKFGEAGRGYAHPGVPWPTFRQEQMTYEMSGSWEVQLGTGDGAVPPFGVGGVRVESSAEGAWIRRGTCREECEHGRAFDRYRVAYLVRPEGGSFEVGIDGERATRIATDGDERRVATFTDRVEPGPHELELELVGDGPVALFGLGTTLGDDGVVYSSLGINGATASQFASFDSRLSRQEIRAIAPDLVVVAFGTNEAYDLYSEQRDGEASLAEVTERMASYHAQFGSLLEHYVSAAPRASCLVLLPPDLAPDREDVGCRETRTVDGEEVCLPPTIRHFSGIVAAQRAAARRHGCAVWDQSRAMGGAGAIRYWEELEPPLARSDGIHLTMEGYDLLAGALFGDLMETYAAWKRGEASELRTRPVDVGSRSVRGGSARPGR